MWLKAQILTEYTCRKIQLLSEIKLFLRHRLLFTLSNWMIWSERQQCTFGRGRIFYRINQYRGSKCNNVTEAYLITFTHAITASKAKNWVVLFPSFFRFPSSSEGMCSLCCWFVACTVSCWEDCGLKPLEDMHLLRASETKKGSSKWSSLSLSSLHSAGYQSSASWYWGESSRLTIIWLSWVKGDARKILVDERESSSRVLGKHSFTGKA